MIYPILTEFEWGIVGLIVIAILIWGIRAIAKDTANKEREDWGADLRESKRRYEQAEREARYRSERYGTDYEEEKRKAMKEAFPGR